MATNYDQAVDPSDLEPCNVCGQRIRENQHFEHHATYNVHTACKNPPAVRTSTKGKMAGGRASAILREPDRTTVTYHGTPVVQIFTDGTIKLDTGGYRTVTTKRRMNQAAREFNLPYSVWQKDYEWYVTIFHSDQGFMGEHKDYPFDDRTFVITPEMRAGVQA